jgi:outer membrane receptor protein involved in Fe transport
MKKLGLLRLGFWIFLFGMMGPLKAQYTVTGTISDGRTKEALPFSNIFIQGTAQGAVSDIDGKFSLEIGSNEEVTLIVSSIGYLSQSVKVSPSNKTLDVQLREDATNLEEVIVTGLATSVKRSNLANAITSVSAKDLVGTTTIQTTDAALYGKVAGANIRSNGGAPGGGVSIQLRGISSLAGASQPLIIVDGVYASNASQRTGR